MDIAYNYSLLLSEEHTYISILQDAVHQSISNPEYGKISMPQHEILKLLCDYTYCIS